MVTSGLGEWAARTAGRAVPTTVIPNGADPTRFHPGATGGPADLPDRYAVFVGELAPWQGIDELVAAFAHDDWPWGLHMVVAGTGVEEHRLAEAPDCPDRRLHHLGRIPHDQVPGLLSGAAVALITSRDRVGTGIAPLKLFEALACGSPVVAWDVADNDRYLPSKALVPAGDVAVLAAAVATIVGGSGRGADGVGPASAHTWRARAAATDHVLRTVRATA